MQVQDTDYYISSVHAPIISIHVRSLFALVIGDFFPFRSRCWLEASFCTTKSHTHSLYENWSSWVSVTISVGRIVRDASLSTLGGPNHGLVDCSCRARWLLLIVVTLILSLATRIECEKHTQRLANSWQRNHTSPSGDIRALTFMPMTPNNCIIIKLSLKTTQKIEFHSRELRSIFTGTARYLYRLLEVLLSLITYGIYTTSFWVSYGFNSRN